ncbi:Fic family protein [Rhodohalobacter sp. SW132]|uniref:Fic family protein n=1 Tax=Rhodohalobacter sp. SW132 TaxID=2293433 RepID=UPI000E2493CE|nr:Fic family protein [Rhodohalobacter sp. SW132]REL24489.1 Fic family protein [Rhodohalobacter sp. SW132]
MSKNLLYPINPDRTKPWNDLPDLPIAPELYRDVEIYEQLGHAKEALALLTGRSIAIPNPSMLINSITLQEAKVSSEIENVFTTDDELYKAVSDTSNDHEASASTKEVLRYREALWDGHHYLKEHGTFDRDYFIRLYRIIQESGDGIRPPFARTFIRMGGTGPNAGKPAFTPPRGKGVVEAKLDNLIEFLNRPESEPADPLLKMCIAHYQFEVIHPFRDGNGRVGRIMNIHIVTRDSQLDLPILYLSRYILEHKHDYYEHLAGVSRAGQWKKWILFMLKAVEWTSRLTLRKVNDIIETREEILQVIREQTDIRRPEDLAEAIFTQPYTKVTHLTDRGLYAENTARNYLNELVELQVLEKKEIKGRHYYINPALTEILSY